MPDPIGFPERAVCALLAEVERCHELLELHGISWEEGQPAVWMRSPNDEIILSRLRAQLFEPSDSQVCPKLRHLSRQQPRRWR
jgi:hypothetical protein